MNIKQLIIAFLSPRYPAAYTEAAIAQRLSSTGDARRRTSRLPSAPCTR